MNRYKVRVYSVGALGFFTQADHYVDHVFDTPETFDYFVKQMIREGFRVGNKWYMPSAIITVEQL